MDFNKLMKMINLETRDCITVVECISSSDKTIFPILLISDVNILHKWCQDNNLDSEALIGNNETDYLNNNTALDLLKHFIDHIQNKR